MSPAAVPVTKRLLADASLLVVATCWGATFPLIRIVLSHLPPFVYLAARFAIASALLLLVAAPVLRSLPGRGRRDGLLVGCALAAGYILQTLGLRTASASVGAFLTGLSVLLVPLLGLLWRQRPSVGEWIGVVFGTAGLALLTLRGFHDPGWGEALLVGCAVCFAFQIVLQGKVAAGVPPTALGALQTLVVAVSCAALAFGSETAHLADTPARVWWMVAGMAVVASAAAFTVQAWAQRFTPPTHVGLLFAFEPVSGALFARWWLGEQMTAAQWLGAVLVLTGIVIAELRPARAVQRT